MNRPLTLSLAVALALASAQAMALGLGTIEVKSKMNEPLLAEIPIVSASPEEAQGVRVQLADAEDFARIGLDVSGLSVPLEFAISSDSAGRPIIIVSSNDPVREPFLSFLVEVDWTNGRLLREFSVLLEPPVAPAIVRSRPIVEPVAEAPAPAPEFIEPSAPVAAETVPAAEPEPAPVFEPVEPIAEPVAPAPEPMPEPTPEPMPEPEPIAAEPAPPPVEEPPPAPIEEPAPVEEPAPAYEPEPPRTPGEYGPVAAGETLWEIANNARAPGVNANQMMVAILRANPEAFYKDNVNALKRGAILRIPAQEEIEAIARSEAAAEVVAQHQAWAAQTVVADSGYAPPAAAPAPTPTPSSQDSRLALVPPSGVAGSAGDRPGTAGGTDQSAALRADLARTKELLASSNQETTELRERVAELEKIQGDTARLLELRSTEMAELQQRLAAAEAESTRLRAEQAAAERAAAEAAAALASNATPESASAPDTSSATPTEPAVPPADAAVAPGTSADDAPVEAALVESAPGDTDASGTAATDPAATDTGTTDVTADASPAEVGTEAASESPTDATGAAEVTALPDPEPVDTSAPIEPDAPSWMAYLRNPWVLGGAGALAILALLALFARTRKREVEAASGERSSVADEFHGGVFGGGAAAAATAAADEERDLLEQLASDPTSVDAHLDLLRLYYARGDADKFEAAAGALYAQVPGPDSPAWLEAAEMGRALCPGNALFDIPVATEREEFDFDHLETATPPPAQPYVPDEPIATRYTPPATTPSAPPAESFDFNLLDDTPRAAPPAHADQSTQQMPALDPTSAAPAPQGDTAADFLGTDDAVGTKLDLARAYLDMGDPEGARSMLQEVLAEGTASQKSEAQRLLADIG